MNRSEGKIEPVREDWMSVAIDLSKRGYPAPNPHVGCVIVSDGEAVGVGYHDHAGGPHAETMALAKAGPRAKGATAYVTLEPCNHEGRTGPCSVALIEAGITRVVFALKDPNSVASGGAARLAEAGIEVISGCMASEAEAANIKWLTAVRRRRPYLVAKAALTLDGRIALPNGQSQWITSVASRRQGHVLRAECGAVLVGRGTVHNDDPELTVRHLEVVNQPTRIVVDPLGRLARSHRVFDGTAPVLHVVQDARDEFQVQAKAEAGGFDLRDLLAQIYSRGITSILVEGGAKTIGGFVSEGLVDRFELFVGPILFGDGPSWLQMASPAKVIDATRLQIERVETNEGDLWITALPGTPIGKS